MSMSESERRLLLSGTLDTSGVHAGEHAFLPEVASAWEAVDVELPNGRVVPASEVQEVTLMNPDGTTVQGLSVKPTEEELQAAVQVVEPEVPPVVEPEVPLVDRPKIPVKRAPAKKTTAPKK